MRIIGTPVNVAPVAGGGFRTIAGFAAFFICNGKIEGTGVSLDVENEVAKMSIRLQIEEGKATGEFNTSNTKGITIQGKGTGQVQANLMTFEWSSTRNDGQQKSGENRIHENELNYFSPDPSNATRNTPLMIPLTRDKGANRIEAMKLVLAVLFLACSLFAAGEAGKWSGRILVENANGRVEQLPLVVILKMEDGKVTGSAGPDEARQSLDYGQ